MYKMRRTRCGAFVCAATPARMYPGRRQRRARARGGIAPAAAESRRRRRRAGCRLAAGRPYPLLSQICVRMIRHPSKQASCTAGSFAESVGEASPCRTVARSVREDGRVARTHCFAVVRAETGDSSLRRSLEIRCRSLASVASLWCSDVAYGVGPRRASPDTFI
jgi:hypothetical protein